MVFFLDSRCELFPGNGDRGKGFGAVTSAPNNFDEALIPSYCDYDFPGFQTLRCRARKFRCRGQLLNTPTPYVVRFRCRLKLRCRPTKFLVQSRDFGAEGSSVIPRHLLISVQIVTSVQTHRQNFGAEFGNFGAEQNVPVWSQRLDTRGSKSFFFFLLLISVQISITSKVGFQRLLRL